MWLAIRRARHRGDLRALDVDPILRVLDLGVEQRHLVFEVGDPSLLLVDLVAEHLLARGRLVQCGAQLLLRRERPGDVAAKTSSQHLIDARLGGWLGGGLLTRRAFGRDAGGRYGRRSTRRVGDPGVEQDDGQEQGQGDDAGRPASHTRYLRKPSVAVSAPSTRPATMTAATMYLIEVSPTPGRTCA